MSAPAPFPRIVTAAVGVLAVLVAAGVVAFTSGGAGGRAAPQPGPSRAPMPGPASGPSSRPTGRPAVPTPEASCLLYDFECQAAGGEGGPVPQPSTAAGGT
ncbi:hypothetical protein [Streptomyces sp. NPDC021356]|uniref:hypothetical protein n=1 Tax=Streptomyces sp. NPDC021356 TaxID=3154900 RepID=UPI0033E5F5B6